MAKIIFLVAALAVSAFAEPLRYRRSDQLITANGAAATAGQGWASDNHQAAVLAVGIPGQSSGGWGQDNSGWGAAVPAAISLVNQGASEVSSGAAILEATSNDGDNLSVVQAINADNVVAAGDSLDLAASGGDVAAASSSAADAGGSGSIASAGDVAILADNASNLGMGKP